MAQRMKARGVAGCVIGGRCRDLAELKESQLPVSEPPTPSRSTRSCPLLVQSSPKHLLGSRSLPSASPPSERTLKPQLMLAISQYRLLVSLFLQSVLTWISSFPSRRLLTPTIQGDIIFCDPVEGVVVIPRGLLDDTIELVPKLVAADGKVLQAVQGGMGVAEAFKTYRN